MRQCPCGSSNAYQACCGLYIQQQVQAKTPEALMRSRYTAYTQANIDYIKRTMQGVALQGFDKEAAEHWARSVVWLGLTVIQVVPHETDVDAGQVEFVATFIEHDKIRTLHEKSQFQRSNGCWFYTGGEHIPAEQPKQKISRNAPCPCGSNKKYKNCHGT